MDAALVVTEEEGVIRPRRGLLQAVVTQTEADLVWDALVYCGGNKSEASKVLGICRQTLLGIIEREGIDIAAAVVAWEKRDAGVYRSNSEGAPWYQHLRSPQRKASRGRKGAGGSRG